MMRVKKKDTVMVITGKDKGKQGVILDILPKKGKVMIKGVAITSKHTKARKQNEVAGIKQVESFVELSKVLPICSACKKPSRVASKVMEDGKKSRVCNRCKEIF